MVGLMSMMVRCYVTLNVDNKVVMQRSSLLFLCTF